MVVDKDGSKWACRTCLLGHRVSSCNHTDRELLPVPRKGRPVSQCQHCRIERKARSAHVKCECGAKPFPEERCSYLQKATPGDVQFTASATVLVDGRALSTHSMDLEPTSLSNDRFTNERHCCCPHGGKCICIDPKQEQLQSNNVPSMKDPDTSDPHMRGKPRAAIQDSRVRLEANVNDRYELLLPNNSTHSQIRSTSKPTHWLNENYEQTTAPPFEDSSARVQDWPQAWPDTHQSVFPNVDDHVPDFSLLGQDSLHSLDDLSNSSLPVHSDMPSIANTFACTLDMSYKGYGSSSASRIPPDIVMSDALSTSSCPTPWSPANLRTDQWSAIDWTGFENLGWTQPAFMNETMDGVFEDRSLSIAEDMSWGDRADAHENIDHRL